MTSQRGALMTQAGGGEQDDVKTQKKRTRANTPHTSTYAHTQSINRTRHQAGDPQQTQQVKTCGGFSSALSRRPADDLFIVVILSNL